MHTYTYIPPPALDGDECAPPLAGTGGAATATAARAARQVLAPPGRTQVLTIC